MANDPDPTELGHAARNKYRRLPDAVAATSPAAVESTLARISDEMMDEAIARQSRQAAHKPTETT